MKISLNMRETSTAGSVYSAPSMESQEQLLPSDEELAERDKEEAARQAAELEQKQKEATKKQAEKKEKPPKTDAEEDDDGDDSDDSGDDDSDDDSDSDSDDESEDGADDDESDDDDSDSDDEDSDDDSDEDEELDDDEEATASSKLPFPDARAEVHEHTYLKPRVDATKAQENLAVIPDDKNASDKSKKFEEAKETAEEPAVIREENTGEELAIASSKPNLPFPDCPIRPL